MRQSQLAKAEARIRKLEAALWKIVNRKPAEKDMANAFRLSRNEAREAVRGDSA